MPGHDYSCTTLISVQMQRNSKLKKFKWTLGGVLLYLFGVALSALGNATPQNTSPLETRCGWFSNPTPANIWLYDRDGQWLIGIQGGYQIKEDWPWPAFKPQEWVKTNGNYGYGCACLKLRADRKSHQVRVIKSATVRPLAACQQDPSLKKRNPPIFK